MSLRERFRTDVAVRRGVILVTAWLVVAWLGGLVVMWIRFGCSLADGLIMVGSVALLVAVGWVIYVGLFLWLLRLVRDIRL